MLNSFEISKNNSEEYDYSYNLNDGLILNYIHEDLFNSYKKEDKTLICYGYCFDVRNPEVKLSDTLKNLLNDSGDFLTNIKYLNGHYILLFNLGNSWELVTDAVSMTPVYVDAVNRKVTTEGAEGLLSLNGFKTLNLNDFILNEIEVPNNKLTDERIERIILDLVMNQYRYFEDKKFMLNFRRNKMNKTIMSILHPVLFGNTLNLRQQDDITKNLSSALAREYKLNVVNEEEENDSLYICNVHLMEYAYFMDIGINFENSSSDDPMSDKRNNIEENIQNHLRYRKDKKNHLLFDPFNVPAIQERIYSFNDRKNFDPLTRIIRIMHPSIDFYDFATGENLLRKYTQVKKRYDKLSKEIQSHKQNQKFLYAAKAEAIEVTDNLDGRVLDGGITFYPATEIISKDEVFEVVYTKKNSGMILVESYFNNPRNAHRIKIDVNGEVSNIDEYHEGKFINVESDIRLKMTYERDYQTASWQKAGRLTIKEID